jgi:hypothetical protein
VLANVLFQGIIRDPQQRDMVLLCEYSLDHISDLLVNEVLFGLSEITQVKVMVSIVFNQVNLSLNDHHDQKKELSSGDK